MTSTPTGRPSPRTPTTRPPDDEKTQKPPVSAEIGGFRDCSRRRAVRAEDYAAAAPGFRYVTRLTSMDSSMK